MTTTISWVVGRGGLLGRAVERELARTGAVWTPPQSVPWGGPGAVASLVSNAEQFCRHAAGATWQLAWCAGAGVMNTGPLEMEAEVRLLRRTLDALATAGIHTSPGAVFVASSAGGVYAGARQPPPFTEQTRPVPLSAYGQAKLDSEHVAIAWGRRTGVPVLIGRIANLYGPGQDLTKPQGLISQFCRAHLTGQPLTLYVPLDTVRDYLFVDDCAAIVASMLREAHALPAGTAATKILASQRGVTIGGVLGEMRRLLRRAPRVVLAVSPAARHQVRDLRLRSVTWPALDRRTLTPLPVGVGATMEDLRCALRAGTL